MIRRIFGNWWFLTGLAVLLLVLVLCVGLPFFVGWMRPLWVRITIGVSLALLWLLWAFLRRRKRRKAAEALEAELTTPSAADEEAVAVAARMREALAVLKSHSGKKRDYLYAQPWYMIIGPPGAGKTTALLNSGLRFPYADHAVQGVGGTRNLDFWFSDEATFVDTAGRYTTQDSDGEVDTSGWQAFLAQLKRHRPLSPINGVLVAIGADELLSLDRAGLDRHAALVRRRLAELRNALQVAIPVYLLVTKSDLIAGFAEFYEDLDVEGRRAVLGATFPESGRPDLDTFVGEFDSLVIAQDQRQARRLFDEVDMTRRSLILGFPTQLSALRNRLTRFVDGAFVAGESPGVKLRGFYFTSGVQEGAPLDRILSGVADAYQAKAAGTGGSGRAYFLNRLLTEVMFGEAGLVNADPAARRRQRTRLTAGLGAVAAIVLLVVGLWAVSFAKNRNFLSDLNGQTQAATTLIRQIGIDLVEVRETDPDLEQSLAALRALRNLPQGYAEQKAGQPGWWRQFGLYQESHADEAMEAYRDGLRRIMLPRLLLRLEQFMQSNTGSPMELYQPLKVYLMLGGFGPMDASEVKSWIAADWEQNVYPGGDQAPVRKELAMHLSALLEDEGMASAWPGGRKAPLDGQTIASTRAALQTLSLADRAYALLKQKATAKGPPWRASAALPAGDGQAFANGDQVRELEVPYFFTSEGYEKGYQLGLANVASDFAKELWVLGEESQTAGVRLQMNQIRPTVARLYAREYIDAWEKVATTPKPANYFADPAALGAFVKTPSPLKILLLELKKNTSFKLASGAAKDVIKDRIGQSRYGDELMGAAESSSGFDVATEVSNHFRGVHEYVGDGEQPSPIDEFVAAVKQAGSAITSARMASGGMGSEAAQGQMAMAMGAIATAAAGAPPLLNDFIQNATKGGSQASVNAAQGALADAYANAVLPDCQSTTQDKYPFVGTAEADASLVDVQKVFGMNGSLDAFVQQRIVPLLDTSGPVWRWDKSKPATADLSPSSPDEFAKAGKLRNLLIGGASAKFQLNAKGARVDAIDLSAGGNTLRFEVAGAAERQLIWSAQGNVPEASLVLYSAANGAGADLTEIKKLEEGGPWALFRLIDHARLENTGPTSFRATFGHGTESVVFKVTLPDKQNPFIRGGSLWSFRCPVTL